MAQAAAATMRYQQLCLLASGGMADLHLARTTGPGGFERLVVVKRLRPQLAESPDLVQMLLDEARIAATLQHNHIVQVHDVTFEGGSVSVVMEYLHGQDARALMKRARAHRADGLLPLDQAIAIALGTCAGLHHAHERVDAGGKPLEIVHRDVSPDNVVVTFDGGVKLIDFGIARARSRLGGQTEQGIAKGKPGYMAPEQILCRPVDRRADIYAAAVLLYEMTCGRLPYDGESDYERFNAAVDDDPIRPRTISTGYPKELEEIVLRGLERDPDRRYETALAMQRALEEFARSRRLDLSSFGLAQLMERLCSDKLDAWRAAQRDGRSLAEHVAALRTSSGAVAPAPEPQAQPRSGRRRVVGVGIGVLGLAAAGLIWWWQGRTGPSAASASPEVDGVEAASAPSLSPPAIERSTAPERAAAPAPEPAADPRPTKRDRRARRQPASPKSTASAAAGEAQEKPKPPAAKGPADPDAFLPY